MNTIKSIELAKQLAKSLTESTEYQDFQKAKLNLEAHEAARLMLEDFRKKQWQLEQKKINGEKLLEPYEEELGKLAEIIGLNPFVREYLMAEYKFMQIIMEIQHILSKALEVEPLEGNPLKGGTVIGKG